MMILHGIILNVRPAKSAEAYASVWSDEGSPLMVHTKNQAEALSKVFMTTKMLLLTSRCDTASPLFRAL